MELPLVAIVGATNVGKSTLFNRLVGRRQAIAAHEPGLTRDRHYGLVQDAPRPFRLVDTGGLDPGSRDALAQRVEQQAQRAIDEADLVLLVLDVRAGSTATDLTLVDRLRRRGRPLLLLANKADTPDVAAQAGALWDLGLGPPLAVSAEHGLGIEELLDAIAGRLPPAPEARAPTAAAAAAPPRVAIVGRPNVGKSSLFNRLAGEERALVSDLPGTTRDAVDTLLALGDRTYRLIDTAGLRRPGHVQPGAERFATQRAREAVRRCDVAILVLDAAAPFAAQDAHVAGQVKECFKPLVIAVNKWDLITEREQAVKRWETELRRRLRFAPLAPIAFVSARSGQRAVRLLELVDRVHAEAGLRVPTPALNRWLGEQAVAAPTTPRRGPGLRIYYATQTGVHPPSFTLFCNDPARVHFSIQRRLENALRERFGFGSAPLRLRFRGRRAADAP